MTRPIAKPALSRNVGARPEELSVGIIGRGAIGQAIRAGIDAGAVPGARVTGLIGRPAAGAEAASHVERLIQESDVIVEAASQEALRAYGRAVIGAGRDLLVVSVGGLADEGFRSGLCAGPGRVIVSSGAIGGLDVLRAGALFGELDRVSLTTTKHPSLLEQPWMDCDIIAALRQTQEPTEVFRGTARAAVERFPKSVNVAATLALAALGFDSTAVRMVADPRAQLNEHLVEASGSMGEYRLLFRNRPSPSNPRSSALTARAVVRSLADRQARMVVGA